MNFMNVSAALMSVGLLMAAPAFAQTGQAQKQPTQEGGPAYPINCSPSVNANPAGDPNCKQQTQNLVPSSGLSGDKSK
jgi:hypothetical protein